MKHKPLFTLKNHIFINLKKPYSLKGFKYDQILLPLNSTNEAVLVGLNAEQRRYVIGTLPANVRNFINSINRAEID